MRTRLIELLEEIIEWDGDDKDIFFVTDKLLDFIYDELENDSRISC